MFSELGLNLEPKLFTPKTGDPQVTLEHFQLFNEHEEAKAFIKLMEEYGSAHKTITTYIDGFLKHLRADGKFHPSYFLFHGGYEDKEGGTDTGRTSAKDPAIQTNPKHTKWAKLLRKGYIAPPGYVIVSADYSQAELRVMAVLSQCKRMLTAYSKGIDLHAVTAASMMGITLQQFFNLPVKERKEARQKAKAVNFGLIYKMSPQGLVLYAKNAYGVELTLEEATIYWSNFLERDYPEVQTYHGVQEDIVREFKFVESPLGRIRHLPLIDSPDKEISSKAVRNAINSPTQGTASDLTMLSMVEIDRQYKMCLFMMVHDNIAAYVPEDEVEINAVRMKNVMENLPLDKLFGWNPSIPFTVDVEYGPNLADLTEIKF